MAKSTKLKLRHISLTIVKVGDNFIVANWTTESHCIQTTWSAYLPLESTGSLFPMSGTKYAATEYTRVNKTHYFSNESRLSADYFAPFVR